MIGWIILGAFVVLLAVLLVRAAMFRPKEEPAPAGEKPQLEGKRIAENLAAMVRCKTVSSYDPSRMDDEEF